MINHIFCKAVFRDSFFVCRVSAGTMLGPKRAMAFSETKANLVIHN